jgi:hypothetical protein
VCLLHTAKPILHTAKALPRATHGKGHTANSRRQRQPLPCVFCRAHGKEFAVCTSDPRQKNLKNIKKNSCPAAEAHHVGPHHTCLGPPCAGRRPSAGLCVRPEAWPTPPLGSGLEVAGGVERGGTRRLPRARKHGERRPSPEPSSCPVVVSPSGPPPPVPAELAHSCQGHAGHRYREGPRRSEPSPPPCASVTAFPPANCTRRRPPTTPDHAAALKREKRGA